MADRLKEKFQKRINNENFKQEFFSLLKEHGHFLKFDEANRAHQYALNLSAVQIQNIVGEPINEFYTMFVALKNGELKVLNVA